MAIDLEGRLVWLEVMVKLMLPDIGRAVMVAGALWLVWVVWQPAYFSLPEDLARPEAAEALVALPVGSVFVLEGVVAPEKASDHAWRGRFAFVHRERRDVSTGLSKEQIVVDVEDWRPAVTFDWVGGRSRFQADSYGLTYAPRIKPRWWPRKALGFWPVDDWHKTSTGFRAGETALAYGRVGNDGRPRVEQLMEAPIEKVAAVIGYENGIRRWLLVGAKSVLTLLCLNYGWPRRGKQTPAQT